MNLIYLARSNTGQPEVADYLDTAEHELKRVSHIAKQTLGYYREHAAAKPVSLAEIVEQTVEMYAPRCLAANIRVELQAATIPRLTLRRGEMMQVFSNLIMNSIYAMPEGGFLHVIMENTTAPHGVAVTIADTGIGISDKNLPHVFDAFFTTRSTIGTGIGLFISKQFVEGHGGSITIASSDSQPARGTEVRVFLPLQTRYELEPSAQ
jgi:signal transduction histidine kinase